MIDNSRSFLHTLRAAYPVMYMSEFLRILDTHQNEEDLLEVLDVAEVKAIERQLEEGELMKATEERLRLAEEHHKLHFVVPPDVDLEHAQAILMYGCLMPGQSRCFAGTHVLPEKNVCDNVEHKLGRHRYDKFKRNKAMAYLKREGVLLVTNNKGVGIALSLNLDEKAGSVSTHGAQIIRIAKLYMYQK